MNIAEKMDRNVNLSPWEEISIITKYEYHTLIEKASIIIKKDESYFYLFDNNEKIKDVSIMPYYIREDWVNYNKKELDIVTLNIHIKEYENRLKRCIESTTFNLDTEKDLEETLQLLKSLRRDLIIKGIV